MHSRSVLCAVVDALDVSLETAVLEIGPGKGALTEYILAKYSSVVAVEKDHDLVTTLQDRFAEEISDKSLLVVRGDVRDGGWREVIGDRPYAVIANIPYYLTGSLIKDLLTCHHPPVALSLVMQKEVAERITRKKNAKESLLSLSVQLFGITRYIQTVPRRLFSPQPTVDSAIVTITDVQQPSQDVQDAFFKIVKMAFQEKRKRVLKKFNEIPRLKHILQKNGVTPTDRAEDVPFAVWYAIAVEYTSFSG